MTWITLLWKHLHFILFLRVRGHLCFEGLSVDRLRYALIITTINNNTMLTICVSQFGILHYRVIYDCAFCVARKLRLPNLHVVVVWITLHALSVVRSLNLKVLPLVLQNRAKSMIRNPWSKNVDWCAETHLLALFIVLLLLFC